MPSKVPVGVLISGSGTNLQALIDACADPEYPARIAVVLSNRADAYGLTRAREAGIPALCLPHRRFPDRETFDRALSEALRQHGVCWVACAGFLRILTPVFLSEWEGRVLNIHPALLPAFPGVDAQAQALEYGVRLTGATVHFVDAGTDSGPIIAQGAVPVLPGDDRERLQRRILSVEHRLYTLALRQAVEGRLKLRGRQVEVAALPGEENWILESGS